MGHQLSKEQAKAHQADERLSKNSQWIIDYLQQQGGCSKEYLLLNHIETHYPDFFSPLGHSPSLFKRHFYLFNQLYQLNQRLIENGQCLIISALEIRLCLLDKESTEIGRADGLKAFYLDQDNLELSESEVTEMMRGFWQKYLALDQKSEAIKTLGLEAETHLDKRILKNRYALLAKQTHPDKGGDQTKFIQIEQAYQCLKQLLTD